ncbi:MAG: TadE family protein [Planctomycetota bacterium]
MTRHRLHGKRRRGAAVVEFAVCAPIIVLLVFGSIEASSFIFLKQSLHVSCYEAIREASRSQGSDATARSIAESILDSRGVNDYVISFPNGESADILRGEEIVCEVTAPTATNSPLGGQFVANRDLTARVLMVKE